MLFLTEVKHQKRPFSSQHTFSSSATRNPGIKFHRQPLGQAPGNKAKSVHHSSYSRRELSNMELEKSIEAIKNKSKAKQKWQKIVEMFHLLDDAEENNGLNNNAISAVTTPKVRENPAAVSIPFSRTMLRAKTRSASKPFFETAVTKSNPIRRGSEEINSQTQIHNQDQIKTQRFNLFECILKANLTERRYKINIPETILMDEQRNFKLLTTENEILTKRNVHKGDIFSILERGHEDQIKRVQSIINKQVYQEMYENFIDTKLNPMAPFVVICSENFKKNLSMEVESARNFGENRWDASRSCYVQRFIFSRNLKAMVLRVIYDKIERGQQKQEHVVHRFQNYASIFRINSNGFNDFLDLKAKVSPSYNREYTLEYSKLTGPGVLNRFIEPTSELRKLIENVHKKQVKKLWVDYIEDLSGKIWVIGVKGVQFQEPKPILKRSLWEVAVQVGSCRLCNGIFQKSQLQNTVSVRMLLEFLHHLRKRTRVQDLENVEFANMSALNRKEKAMSAVCQCCYALIIRELYLKKCQRQLGKLCNIRIQDEGDPPKTEGRQLYQWRLMVYLQEIYQETKDFHGEFHKKKIQNVITRYVLAKGMEGMEEKWKCKVEQKTIPVKRVKVHYFFSQSDNIEEFLKNTQILVSVLSGEREEKEDVIAQGSTGILANFRNKFVTENGQRQTTTVLLFFQSGKYCALTLKVGLVYDGRYKIPEMPMKKLHSVEFPIKECLNSNPLPKQWMQAIGYDQQIQLKDVKYQDLLKDKININGRPSTGLKKKTMKPSW